MDEDTIVIDEKTKKPVISEELCSGCGICTNRCPFNAINIINLPEALKEPIHRYGQNSFELFGLPNISSGSVVGLLGPNGIGKSTILRILAGELKPNLGNWEDTGVDGKTEDNSWNEIINHFKGSVLQDYFKKLSVGDLKVVHKPQMIEQLPKYVKGNVEKLLISVDERGEYDNILETLDLKNILDREIANLSGGELQRVAIAASVLKEGEFYYFDEPTSWLDVSQRLNATKAIRSLADAGKSVMVIEHDLATLDAISDYVHILYGKAGAYGVVSHMKGVRVGINAYINGFLQEENVRIRKQAIEFTVRPPRVGDEGVTLTSYTDLKKTYDRFILTADEGEIYHDEIVTAFGPNGIGKTTFVKMLANVIESDEGEIDEEGITVAYKPQYLASDDDRSVEDFLYNNAPSYGSKIFKTEIMKPFALEELVDKKVSALSGGELQRLSIATTLAKDTQIYLFDEPTAFLDIEQRIISARTIRKIVESKNAASIIIDHDIVFIDYISDRAMVFQGQSGIEGHANAPTDLRNSMNKFLSSVNITFRRDKETKRPRVNKLESYLDREQKEAGEYYYLKD